MTMLSVTFLLVTLSIQNRLVEIGPYYVCAGIFVYPFTYIIADIIAEVYGYKMSRQIIWLTIVSTLIFAIIVKLTTKTPYPYFWGAYNGHFDLAMSPILRTVISGTTGIVVGQFVNIYLITKLKILTKGKHFWLRSIGSTMMGDIFTVSIALFGIFSQRISTAKILEIVILELIIMFVFAIVMSVPGQFIVGFFKEAEGIDIYDYSTNFNPFKLNINNKKS